jgi:ribonuclease-3
MLLVPRSGETDYMNVFDAEQVRDELELPHAQDPELLRQAFAHGSYVREQGLEAIASNQRLEFLGDAVLDMVLAHELYISNPDLPEGELTKLKAALVRAETLAHVARELNLGKYLLLGRGEEETGGRGKPSLLADCLEALIAAIYLSGGWPAASDFIMRHLWPLVAEIEAGEHIFDHKSTLQETIQAHGGNPPHYITLQTLGPPHRRVFEVEVRHNGQVLGTGRGASKQEAEQDAARDALACSDEWLAHLTGSA